MIEVKTLTKAREARCLVCISFHYVEKRICYLFETIRILVEFLVEEIDIHIITNEDGASSSILELISKQFTQRGARVIVRTAGPLAHPFDLTWEHKILIKEIFLAEVSRYSHFIYLEDDIRLPFSGFCYFLAARSKLAVAGLIPSFLRYEFDHRTGAFTASDQRGPSFIGTRSVLEMGGTSFWPVHNPYCGMFILDRDLAEEHIVSAAFDRIASQQLCNWPVRERAAMGQCFVNVPPGKTSRYVIAVNSQTLIPDRLALVHHLPNNYIANEVPGPLYPFGKTPLEQVLKQKED